MKRIDQKTTESTLVDSSTKQKNKFQNQSKRIYRLIFQSRSSFSLIELKKILVRVSKGIERTERVHATRRLFWLRFFLAEVSTAKYFGLATNYQRLITAIASRHIGRAPLIG